MFADQLIKNLGLGIKVTGLRSLNPKHGQYVQQFEHYDVCTYHEYLDDLIYEYRRLHDC